MSGVCRLIELRALRASPCASHKPGMVRILKADMDKLEEILEKYRLSGVLGALATICEQRAEQARLTFNDQRVALLYDNDAKRLDTVAAEVST